MADHVVVERNGSGTSAGVMVGIVLVVLVGIVALFFLFGGPGRMGGSSTSTPPSNTNVNLPAQGQQPAAAPNINVPKQIDVNVNNPAQQAPAEGTR